MRKLLYTFIQTGLFAIISCVGLSLQAQDTPFIQPVSASQIPDSQEMATYGERLRKNPNITGYHFIKLNELATSQKDGILLLHIPGGPTITAVASHVEYESASEYEWIGKTDEDRGTVIIVSKVGRVCAHISTPAGVYEIFPAPSGLYCLHVIDPEKAWDVGCATTSSVAKPENGGTAAAEPAIKQEGNVNAKMQPCQALTYPRVLVLYTPKALTLAGSTAVIADHVNLSISQFNSCIYNSGITSAAALVLAGVAPLNNLSETGSITNDLNSLVGNANAQNLRNQHQADLVVLLTDSYYQGGDTRGKSQTVTLENSNSYSIVELWCATSHKTFAHEIGHLYGCRHEDDNTALPSYAKGYKIKFLGFTVDRTMMVGNGISGDQAKNRLLNFSNPNIQVSGRATGTNDENNAQRITESHPIVGAFRPDPANPLNVFVDGPTWVSSPGGKNYELYYSCGSAPYTFSWQYSYDGINYILSNITSDVFTWYFNQNQKIYIKGTVTSNGQSAIAYITVTAQLPANPYKVSAAGNDTIALQHELPGLIATPNPADDRINISYNLQFDMQVKLDMLDQSGKVIEILKDDKIISRKGRYSATVKSKNLPVGTYFIRLLTSQGIKTCRVIITK
ncbi:MAG: zinc-dependent metalloprotease [Dyadobacter sp.]|uniref:M12 family metallo-peptidase n=1 Tax=Dyadobacter sp. TaxID=1914288 RepID=UPI001B004A29|nr:M12 family metallo-peptidase [Dyadobacter sp.]MBO9615754.1 zinc-dependent metalloprotease [Dyadobacter sp.]